MASDQELIGPWQRVETVVPIKSPLVIDLLLAAYADFGTGYFITKEAKEFARTWADQVPDDVAPTDYQSELRKRLGATSNFPPLFYRKGYLERFPRNRQSYYYSFIPEIMEELKNQ